METASLARYGPVARGFHWTLALLIIGSIGLGWYVMSLSYYDRWYYTSLEWHKALGMAALVARGPVPDDGRRPPHRLCHLHLRR